MTADNSYLYTRKRFNDEDVARDYVVKKNTLSTTKNRREMACIMKAVAGLPAGSRVLDLPCGTGRLESMLLGKGFKVVAADYSTPMLEQARALHEEALADSGVAGRLRFERQDVMKTTYANGEFDAVICNRLFHHYPEPETRRAALGELSRIFTDRLVLSYYDSFSLSTLRFRLRNRLRGKIPRDRIPIPYADFRRDFESCGLRAVRKLPVRAGVSPQTYLVLAHA
jgi:ubiquinone/menaquinone biosynthesis C-methylase UbiE